MTAIPPKDIEWSLEWFLPTQAEMGGVGYASVMRQRLCDVARAVVDNAMTSEGGVATVTIVVMRLADKPVPHPEFD